MTQNKNHIVNLDTNNLYGCAMSRFTPTKNFEYIDPEDIDSNKHSSNSLKSCVLEVDLEYPKELGELHNDYPLAPDKANIEKEMLSNYQLSIANVYNILLSYLYC